MNKDELLRKNNVLMSHGNLPCDTTTCETYGLSGNCGKDCSNFKSKTCDVYVDVLERINEELQQENHMHKEVIDKIKKICHSVPPTWSICGTQVVDKIEKVLKEVE